MAGQPFHIPDHELSAAGPSDPPQPASFYCSAGEKRHSTLDLKHTPRLTDRNIEEDLGLKHINVAPAIIITNTLKRTHHLINNSCNLGLIYNSQFRLSFLSVMIIFYSPNYLQSSGNVAKSLQQDPRGQKSVYNMSLTVQS